MLQLFQLCGKSESVQFQVHPHLSGHYGSAHTILVKDISPEHEPLENRDEGNKKERSTVEVHCCIAVLVHRGT